MTPLYDIVKHYGRIKARFHMPSHSGTNIRGERLYSSAAYDITELSFSDNLSFPTGVIKEAEKLAAKAYKADETLFFAGGATDAIQTTLWTLRKGKIAFLGDMHKSFYSAARLFHLDIINISHIEEIEKGMTAVCVTSPDYFGRVKDLSRLSEKCKEVSAALVVDEAHGAHFVFSSLLPRSAIADADFVIHGAHKTLPVYTGGAMLHVRKAYADMAREARTDVISTSPSYLVMASMDYARDLFEKKGEAMYAILKVEVDRLKMRYKNVELLPSDDFTRVVFLKENAGHALAAALEKGGVFVEAADRDRVVLILTPFNVKWLKKAFAIADGFQGRNAEYPDISDIIGKKSARDVGVYPPGVPLVHKGEIFTKEKVEVLQSNLDRLFGTVDGKILVE